MSNSRFLFPSSQCGNVSCYTPTSLKTNGTPQAKEALGDESSFTQPATQAVTFLQRTSGKEATEAFVGLLQLLDSRHEAVIQRVEERMHQTMLEHLDRVTETICGRLLLSGKQAAAPSSTGRASNPPDNAQSTGLASNPQNVQLSEIWKENSIAPEVGKVFGDASKVPQASSAMQVAIPVDAKMLETNAAGDAEQVPPGTRPQTSKRRRNEEEEKLEIEIVEAQGLVASDVQSCFNKVPSSDPYVTVSLGEQGHRKQIYKSNWIKSTVNPVWHAFCKVKVDPSVEEVVVEVWDHDALGKDDLLGRVILNLSDIRSADGNLTRWFDIVPTEECPSAGGKILLKASLPTCKNRADAQAFFSLLGAADVADELPEEEQQDLEQAASQAPCLSFAKFQYFVTKPAFDGTFCGLIVLNALSMMVEMEYNGRKLESLVGLDERGSSSNPILESTLNGLNTFFAIAFMLELIVRLTAFGLEYLRSPANWLDIIVVLSSVPELLGTGTVMNLTFLRLIRLSKLARLLRIVLLAKFCDPLRILMKAIYTGFGSLFWSFVLLFMIEVIGGLFMTQILADAMPDENIDIETRRFIYTYYGTTSRSTLTMFQITMAPGAWGLLGRPLIEEVSGGFAWFFIFYVGLVSFAIIRIITALFLRQTLQVAASDDQLMRNEKVKAQRRCSESIRELFNHANSSGSGEVTFDEFQKLLMDEQVRGWLQVLELNPKNASYIFELLDDGDMRLTLDEFLSGVFRLKGTAQQIDMVMLQRETREIKNMMLGKIKGETALSRSRSEVGAPPKINVNGI